MTRAGIPRRWWVVSLVLTWVGLLALQEALSLPLEATVTIGACIGAVLVAVDARIARRRHGPARDREPSAQ